MSRIIIFILGAALTAACQAQLGLTPPAKMPVADPAMVIDDRGAQLEVLSALRAVPISPGAATPQGHRVVAASATAKFTRNSLGVVFNHAMQARGTLSGEIAFKMKGTLQATPQDFPSSDFPGLLKVTNPNVFVVVARTPSEYVAVYNRLKGRSDVEWVESIVDYSGGAAAPREAK